ncbi:MAG TPA: hypothetical protein VFQ45_21430 [Longimicrobium sp.]|nr:hypothetical protein [Longimicrobium sp.]
MYPMRAFARTAPGRVVLALLAMLALLALAACAAIGVGRSPPEHVDLDLDPARWTRVLHASDNGMSVTEYVPPGETAEEWTRFVSITILNDTLVRYSGARAAMTECRALLQATCPGAVWTVLRDSDRDLLYEWTVAGCEGEPDQHEVGRLIKGGHTLIRITFSVKGRMDAATRTEWLRRIARARFVDAPEQ